MKNIIAVVKPVIILAALSLLQMLTKLAKVSTVLSNSGKLRTLCSQFFVIMFFVCILWISLKLFSPIQGQTCRVLMTVSSLLCGRINYSLVKRIKKSYRICRFFKFARLIIHRLNFS